MQCPKCDIEMEKGFILSARNVFWSPNSDTYRWYYPKESVGELNILAYNFFGSSQSAYLCRSCQLTVVEYGETEEVEEIEE